MTDKNLVTVRSDADLDRVCNLLDEHGAVVVEEFLAPDIRQALWADLGPALEKFGYGDNDFSGHKTKRMSSLFARSRHTAAVALHPLFLGAARQLIQQPVPVWFSGRQVNISPNIQVSATQMIQIWPDEGAQWLHRDDTSHLRPYPAPTTRVQVMVAMTDFTAENGATMTIPGSHRWDDERAPRRDEAVPAEMPAGSALIWLGGLYHGGGHNASTEPRTGLTLSYIAGNMRQEENQYLAVPMDVVREYPEELQRLLGYDVCPPFLGWYESSNPHTLLAERAG
ncbi:phytanoyl-CoA dioxygenase family protein [Streptomyces scabiei]|uniref:phytanoyl-CoA dioxygenase family protein n=1 Tax=Streptomyces scabiei TaxID=1930 RepID=UPI00298FDBEC|nr:phytanoyl-CoA dioxygenase family protein [Streptomyces scabiei]MDW8803347.1 phytanoyl-CoA dioxygenase family protein [Streptomyces scabiei]